MNRGVPRRRAISLAVGITVGSMCLLAACGGSPTPAPPQAAAALSVPISLNGCAGKSIPTGFVLDDSHSGTMSPAQYSASGDIQASLIYDHFQHGLRDVYTDLALPTPDPADDQVIECVAMRFSNPENANRFLQSFEYLRSQAKGIAKKVVLPSHLAGDAVGYRELQQAFTGYHIASTTVMEVAIQDGDDFYDVSVAGPDPELQTAFGYLKALAGSA
jgi:hypothetical protein